jgi:hypothetical protein
MRELKGQKTFLSAFQALFTNAKTTMKKKTRAMINKMEMQTTTKRLMMMCGLSSPWLVL